MIAAVIVASRFVVRPALKFVASHGSRDVFTAAALLLVIGTALLMQKIGLSMALGAFLAGVLLADSEFRHELEADIEPFKGLLLGLFFMAVGMCANLGLLARRRRTILGLALGLMLVKAACSTSSRAPAARRTRPRRARSRACRGRGVRFRAVRRRARIRHARA